jgi:EAL domain-containing protein (putative c-di-GMP-specific phosphodiesterase class I)/ActR/RegA family two-component response regulator
MTEYTILLVDDDPDVLASYRAALQTDYQLLEASGGLSALELLSESEVDLVISDIAMPKLNGMQLLREIRTRDLDVPVVLITGDPHLETATEAVEYGAMRYLTKPVNLRELQGVAASGVRFRRMADAKRKAFAYVSGRAGTAADQVGQLARFERALKTLHLNFQPVVSWREKRAIGFECLLRCEEPSLQNPPDLIRVAEELGRMDEVSRAIRKNALAAIPKIPSYSSLYLNLHYSDLDDPDLFDKDSPFVLASNRIVLEITERVSLDAIADAEEKVAALRGLGFRIAMDDLGAGHNGLAAFAKLSPEVVKLDMLLVRDVNKEIHKHGLIRVMRDYCAKERIQFISEGVETKSELDTLLDIGCDLFQGYLFGKPSPVIKLPQFKI